MQTREQAKSEYARAFWRYLNGAATGGDAGFVQEQGYKVGMTYADAAEIVKDLRKDYASRQPKEKGGSANGTA